MVSSASVNQVRSKARRSEARRSEVRLYIIPTSSSWEIISLTLTKESGSYRDSSIMPLTLSPSTARVTQLANPPKWVNRDAVDSLSDIHPASYAL